MDSELHVLETRDGPIIAACVKQGGQAYETLDARCIAHSLEHGRSRETHPDRATHRRPKAWLKIKNPKAPTATGH
jgi:hypothetical protein